MYRKPFLFYYRSSDSPEMSGYANGIEWLSIVVWGCFGGLHSATSKCNDGTCLVFIPTQKTLKFSIFSRSGGDAYGHACIVLCSYALRLVSSGFPGAVGHCRVCPLPPGHPQNPCCECSTGLHRLGGQASCFPQRSTNQPWTQEPQMVSALSRVISVWSIKSCSHNLTQFPWVEFGWNGCFL